MNIILIGLMGSGKSSVGRTLAETLGRPFVDTDDLVILQAGRTITEIFSEEGEAGFRLRESQALESACMRDGQVIATGGGAVIAPANRVVLRSSGLVFWLDAPPDELLRRAVAQGIESRPLLAGADALTRLAQLAATRDALYQQTAHIRVDSAGRSIEEIVSEICDRLRCAE